MKQPRRYELTDEQWAKVEPLLSGRKGTRGRPADNNRQFLNAIMWIARTGAPWRDLPERYGERKPLHEVLTDADSKAWKNTHRRFSRWATRGVWRSVFAALNVNADMEYLMMDSTIIKAHQHSAGAKKGLKELLGVLAEV